MDRIKKSQIWYMDFILGLTLFLLIIVIAFRFVTTSHIYTGKETSLVLAESDKLSGILMSTGIPATWTPQDVVIFGLMQENNVLNTTKLEYFQNMSLDDYEDMKLKLSLNSDFILYFQNRTGGNINITNTTYIGCPGYTPETIEAALPEDLITVTRYVVYKYNGTAEIVALKVVVWQG
ncbi:hypothetical protein JXC34_04845 [Candidatus Woesearchaeota archaeon]|nr:hypothetical protein [Candidatus Woesearchaeota archaeon]